jgi:superfamily II DNA or RNA helicase
MLLQSIIGQTVHTLSTKEAVDGSYICPHEYRIVELESSNPNYSTQDALEAKRVHYLKNKNIASFVAKLANAEGLVKQRQTLILVEELEQISMLLPLMRVPVAIAHSEKKLERLLTLNISKVNPSESVEKFNKGEALVLIGTSCISTGTNIFPVHNCVNWQGGSSPIKTKQGAVGRAIRLGKHNPWADKCQPKDKAIIWDFRVGDIEIMVKHLQERLSCYQESGSQILTVKLKR